MIPYIYTPYGNISTFTFMIICGMLSFIGITHIELKKSENIVCEENFIYPKILASGIIAFAFSAIFDALFKLRSNGAFVLSGVTFYGGLIGSVICMYIMLCLSRAKTQYTQYQWFDFLTLPLIVFHIWGRIGCFLAGCCYGKATDSILGVVFPDNEVAGIFHYGEKLYPTQIFEVLALTIILIIVLKASKKFNTYLILYAISRFFIEFFRGDDRGNLFVIASPAQIISIMIVLSILIIEIRLRMERN